MNKLCFPASIAVNYSTVRPLHSMDCLLRSMSIQGINVDCLIITTFLTFEICYG